MLRCRYTPVPSEFKNGVIDMTFTFDTATGQLQHLHGCSPIGQLSFNFAPPPTAAAP
jgi:putative component of membrane protein insertase Oxa1/YidC/SpoIIIJ protein YidD